jgi:hypothetical protein
VNRRNFLGTSLAGLGAAAAATAFGPLIKVRRVFNRYLAREPSSAELAHFAPTLDASKPDMRPLVQAVLSSREYFDQ